MYPGPGEGFEYSPDMGQSQFLCSSDCFQTEQLSVVYDRLFIAWLNDASLEFGGQLISPPPIE